jgi:hypothetical protein
MVLGMYGGPDGCGQGGLEVQRGRKDIRKCDEVMK